MKLQNYEIDVRIYRDPWYRFFMHGGFLATIMVLAWGVCAEHTSWQYAIAKLIATGALLYGLIGVIAGEVYADMTRSLLRNLRVSTGAEDGDGGSE